MVFSSASLAIGKSGTHADRDPMVQNEETCPHCSPQNCEALNINTNIVVGFWCWLPYCHNPNGSGARTLNVRQRGFNQRKNSASMFLEVGEGRARARKGRGGKSILRAKANDDDTAAESNVCVGALFVCVCLSVEEGWRGQ